MLDKLSEQLKKEAAVANAPQRQITEATRVPMNLPNLKLAVPEVPGYYLYWHLGKNVKAALRAGYTHVEDDELDVVQHGVANSAAESGSSDMGSRISILAGGSVADDDPEPARLYLMKLPMEWHEQDTEALGKKNEAIAAALRGGALGSENDPDRAKRVMKAGQDLFVRKR
jgi:hypothetical protein